MSFPHLLKPLALANIVLKNRVVMGSMHTSLEETDQGFVRVAAFYRERAKGGVGLIITGGISPNQSGIVAPDRAIMQQQSDVKDHQVITDAVHEFDCKICMQILHAGRYGYHANQVAPSAIQAPISLYAPRALTVNEIENQIHDFVQSAVLAKQAGYDGVEIMGSEGYLINQFIVKATNERTDNWGGSFENRIRFALEIVKRTRAAVGNGFLLIFRLSMIDLIEQGSSAKEVITLAKLLEHHSVNIINTGIGWHESRVPTIAASVPSGLFVPLSENIKQHISIPVITSNRINTPEQAEQIIANNQADLVSMARPFLADSNFVNKAMAGKSDEINTCIACNQGCLDKIFVRKTASCLVNPRACNETTLNFTAAKQVKKLAVVGAGPAGLAFAKYAAQRGHQVTLFEANDKIGGQFNLASKVPGKEEFLHTLRYFKAILPKLGVEIKLNVRVSSSDLADYDEVVLATGVRARVPDIPGLVEGINSGKVLSYQDVLLSKKQVGQHVAIIGGGGIGFDVALFLVNETGDPSNRAPSIENKFMQEWGIDLSLKQAGGLTEKAIEPALRTITMLQRRLRKPGADLGKTTGWIHRQHLKNKKVKMTVGVTYEKIDQQGLHLLVRGKPRLLVVDHIINCTGQLEENSLAETITDKPCHLIGGAKNASSVDAERAILEAAQLAQVI
ncbi:2,4-dienoyl-CoA reductase FMN-binding domain-containing protein [Colwellia sp. 12G3]|uniref:2,4-dienoyl-CoA reductase FMN-binding domain-containing protein n=1 Tax=Colwellia sp. 12G3 TaxID=2058299 RepID=UPI000C33747E|nr:NADPH-dependent 2,4-dienoyl-CoA reductase [Colwellia sp. 12G3]PKI13853.1 NADPH-dependent 2,4-dienoyl-CoA reductase [Colwellia sp. 12G3]